MKLNENESYVVAKGLISAIRNHKRQFDKIGAILLLELEEIVIMRRVIHQLGQDDLLVDLDADTLAMNEEMYQKRKAKSEC